jgi:hypothetical protein
LFVFHFSVFSRQFKIIPRVEKAPSQNQHWRLISVFGGHSLGRNEPLKKIGPFFYLVEKTNVGIDLMADIFS